MILVHVSLLCDGDVSGCGTDLNCGNRHRCSPRCRLRKGLYVALYCDSRQTTPKRTSASSRELRDIPRGVAVVLAGGRFDLAETVVCNVKRDGPPLPRHCRHVFALASGSGRDIVSRQQNKPEPYHRTCSGGSPQRKRGVDILPATQQDLDRENEPAAAVRRSGSEGDIVSRQQNKPEPYHRTCSGGSPQRKRGVDILPATQQDLDRENEPAAAVRRSGSEGDIVSRQQNRPAT
ncbi:hypothetical protein J6590_074203 [Homalodisca vitripennis]|nr:hypothetical protein J6590_074203 [Homalodisca vitripennis]